ncbi:alpha/beta hydrolase [Flavobacteriaceae bacterium 3-367]
MRNITLLLSLFSVLQCTAQSAFFTTADSVKIAYTDEGKGIAVLLIHGFINSGSSWDKTVLKKELLANGYRVIVPDLRGNGLSDKPQTKKGYAKDVEVHDMKALADYLKLKQYMAVGYSRGSIVLAKLLTVDKRIVKGVLGGMGIDFSDPNWERRKMFAAAFNGKTTPETQGAVDYARSIGADLRSLYLQQEYQPVTLKEELGTITAQTLIISGDLDTDNGDPGELQRAIPKSGLQIVAGDHNGTYKTEAFSKRIISFLE